MTQEYTEAWLHIAKYTADRTLSNPYLIMRRGQAVWDPSLGRWSLSGSTYGNLVLRPEWNSNSNIWVFILPQDSDIESGMVSLSLYDAAEGAEDPTDIPVWAGYVQIEKRPNGIIRFVNVPVVF